MSRAPRRGRLHLDDVGRTVSAGDARRERMERPAGVDASQRASMGMFNLRPVQARAELMSLRFLASQERSAHRTPWRGAIRNPKSPCAPDMFRVWTVYHASASEIAVGKQAYQWRRQRRGGAPCTCRPWLARDVWICSHVMELCGCRGMVDSPYTKNATRTWGWPPDHWSGSRRGTTEAVEPLAKHISNTITSRLRINKKSKLKKGQLIDWLE
jgi:hypothetical protein